MPNGCECGLHQDAAPPVRAFFSWPNGFERGLHQVAAPPARAFFHAQVARPVAGKVQAILIRAARHRPHKTSQPPHQGHIRWSGNESLPSCRARQKTGNRKQVAPSLRDSGHLRNRFPALERGANVRCASGAGMAPWM